MYHFERYDLALSYDFMEHAVGGLIIDDTVNETIDRNSPEYPSEHRMMWERIEKELGRVGKRKRKS